MIKPNQIIDGAKVKRVHGSVIYALRYRKGAPPEHIIGITDQDGNFNISEARSFSSVLVAENYFQSMISN
jgi:hypothetical protein